MKVLNNLLWKDRIEKRRAGSVRMGVCVWGGGVIGENISEQD